MPRWQRRGCRSIPGRRVSIPDFFFGISSRVPVGIWIKHVFGKMGRVIYRWAGKRYLRYGELGDCWVFGMHIRMIYCYSLDLGPWILN